MAPRIQIPTIEQIIGCEHIDVLTFDRPSGDLRLKIFGTEPFFRWGVFQISFGKTPAIIDGEHFNVTAWNLSSTGPTAYIYRCAATPVDLP